MNQQLNGTYSIQKYFLLSVSSQSCHFKGVKVLSWGESAVKNFYKVTIEPKFWTNGSYHKKYSKMTL